MFHVIYLKMKVFYYMIISAYKKCKNWMITGNKDFGNEKAVVVVVNEN